MIIIYKGKEYGSVKEAQAAANLPTPDYVLEIIENIEEGYTQEFWRIVEEGGDMIYEIQSCRRETAMEAARNLEGKRKYRRQELENLTCNLQASVKRLADLEQEGKELQETIEGLPECL